MGAAEVIRSVRSSFVLLEYSLQDADRLRLELDGRGMVTRIAPHGAQRVEVETMALLIFADGRVFASELLPKLQGPAVGSFRFTRPGCVLVRSSQAVVGEGKVLPVARNAG